MLEIRRADKNCVFENWPNDWPAKDRYVSQHGISEEQYLQFKSLIEQRVNETTIEKFLSANKDVVSLLISLFSTGHHASWLYPKEVIRPASGEVGGMIPDYVLAGANSDGISWFVLELKGPNHSAFVKRGKRVYLSSAANKGICQLINYIDVSTRSQSYLRDELRLNGYREPNGILLIGDEEETVDQVVQEFKGAWNRMNPRAQIVSYSRLLRIVEQELESK